MATDPKRRQKKLERRNTKRKERRKTLVKQKNRGLAERLASAANAPVLDCLVTDAIWDQGLGNALLSRQLRNGSIAFGMFLVDRYCLGIKDAFGRVVSKGEYGKFLETLQERCTLVELSPENLCCLIDDAVDFARQLGFEPHPDYRRTKPILGDIDREAATERFQFGDETGKPHFIAGPHDDPQRCYQILSILEHGCGTDGFHYTMPLLGGDSDLQLISTDFGSDEEDDFEDWRS